MVGSRPGYDPCAGQDRPIAADRRGRNRRIERSSATRPLADPADPDPVPPKQFTKGVSWGSAAGTTPPPRSGSTSPARSSRPRRRHKRIRRAWCLIEFDRHRSRKRCSFGDYHRHPPKPKSAATTRSYGKDAGPATSSSSRPALHRGPLAELVAIRLDAVDLDGCRIRITCGKGGKDPTVPHLNGVTVVLTVTRPHSLLRSYRQ
jgi:hypothetical protein